MGPSSSTHPVVVVGGGIGGLACALAACGRGLDVVVLERAEAVGGKVRVAAVGDREIDCGPTVLTMRAVFDSLFERAGLRLDEWLQLRPLSCLARHAWRDGSRLDLYTDEARSADAIADFAGSREADGYRRFVRYGAELLTRLEQPFLQHDNDGLLAMMGRVGLRGLPGLSKVDFGRSMWTALGDFFEDARLRQLFARYATYYGSSPFSAPATLNLIASVEQRGVWAVEGGMIALARAMAGAIERCGGRVLTGCGVAQLECGGDGRVDAVVLDDGRRMPCAALVWNGDPRMLADGSLGDAVQHAVRPTAAPDSLSAMTWSMLARPTGLELAYHTVCFSDDYVAEFDELFTRRRVPTHPTVYVCAQDRVGPAPSGDERLFCLVNAPAGTPHPEDEESTCRARMLEQLSACGLTFERTDASPIVAHTPSSFAGRFPGTRGAIYGAATHGAMAPFQRYRHRTKIRNLWLVGGAVHPGAGLPMVTMGGSWVADALATALPSTPRSRRAATSGGTSTGSPTTGSTR